VRATEPERRTLGLASATRTATFGPWNAEIDLEDIPGTSDQVNLAGQDGCPIESPDGLSHFLASNRPRVGAPWGAPENLGAPVNSASDDFCPTPIPGRWAVLRQPETDPGPEHAARRAGPVVRPGTAVLLERLAIALEIAHGRVGIGRFFEEIIAELRVALAEGADTDPGTAMLAQGLLLMSVAQAGQAGWLAQLDAALAMYADGPDGLGRRVLANFLSFIAALRGDPINKIRELALQAVGDEDDYTASLEAGWQLGLSRIALAVAGEWELAERRLAQGLRSAHERGSPRAVMALLYNRLGVRMMRGDLVGAESDGLQALDLLRTAHSPMIRVGITGELLEVVLDRSGTTAAQLLIDELALDGDPALLVIATRLRCARSRLRLAQGRPEDALADIEAANEVLRRMNITYVALELVQVPAAAALAALGRHDEARAAARDAMQSAITHGGPGPIGIALRTAALLKRGPSQIAQLTEAIKLLETSGRRVEHARSLIDLGAALRRQGEPAPPEARSPRAGSWPIAAAPTHSPLEPPTSCAPQERDPDEYCSPEPTRSPPASDASPSLPPMALRHERSPNSSLSPTKRSRRTSDGSTASWISPARATCSTPSPPKLARATIESRSRHRATDRRRCRHAGLWAQEAIALASRLEPGHSTHGPGDHPERLPMHRLSARTPIPTAFSSTVSEQKLSINQRPLPRIRGIPMTSGVGLIGFRSRRKSAVPLPLARSMQLGSRRCSPVPAARNSFHARKRVSPSSGVRRSPRTTRSRPRRC
jgi:tetratricopeptide (TPR) repeat protein